MHDLVKQVLAKAQGELAKNVREDPPGSNDGPEVRAYLKSTGLGPGHPWCAAFLTWCVRQVEKEKDVDIAWPRTASCDVMLTFARRHDILFTQPEKADAFLVMASTNDATHTGFVTGVDNGRFTTIEGNSNRSGSREGIGVFDNSRPITSRYRFLRWRLLLPGAVPQQEWTLLLSGRPITENPGVGDPPYLIVNDGLARVRSRVWADALGFDLDWDKEQRAVLLDGKIVPATPLLREGESFLPVRVLAEFSGLNIEVEGTTIKVTRPR